MCESFDADLRKVCLETAEEYETMPALAAVLEGTVVPYLRSVRELLVDLKVTTYNRYERLQILKAPRGRWH